MKYLLFAIALCFLSTACAHNADYVVCDPTAFIGIEELITLDISNGDINVEEMDRMEAAASEAGWDMEDRELGLFSKIFIKSIQRIGFYRAYDDEHEGEAGASASASLGDGEAEAEADSDARREYRKDRRTAFKKFWRKATKDFANDMRTTCQAHPFTPRLEGDRIELVKISDDPERPYEAIVIFNDKRVSFASPKIGEDERLENYRFRVFHTAMRHLLYYIPESEPPAYISE